MKKSLFITMLTISLLATSSLANAQEAQRSVNDDLLYRVSFGRLEDIKMLLDNGAETNFYGNMGDTPLMLGINRGANEAPEIVKALLAKGADPNFPDRNGVYPLESAIKNAKAGVVSALIEGGADIHLRTRAGLSMIDTANQLGNTDIAKLLNEQYQKEVAQEASKHDPARLPVLMQQFSSQVCEMTYWTDFLASEQNPSANDATRSKIARNKMMGEKYAQELTLYFPNVKLDSYIKYSGESINNVFRSLTTLKSREESGIGKDEDAHKRCSVIGDGARDSIIKILEEQKAAQEKAAKQAELMRR